MSNPLISVIIPCYNAEKFVEKAIRSVMIQTYKNLEILCCDDCSTDSTLQILQDLAKEDSRIKIIHNEQNLRLIDTLNKLVTLTTGDYIARMDSDDICLLTRLEKQLEFMQQNPDVDFCGCNAFHINEQDKIIGKSCLPIKYEDCKYFLKFYSTFYHPTIFAKAEVFKKNPYDKNFIHAEDYELWCRLIYEKGLKGENLEERLLKYRLNSNGISLQNALTQARTSAKIFDKYEMVPSEIVEVHKDVFIYQSEKFNKNNLKLLSQELKQLKYQKLFFSEKAYLKYLYYLKIHNYIKEFIKAVLCPLGIFVVLKSITKKRMR